VCEAIVYLNQGDQQEEIMRDVAFLRPEGKEIFLATILGDQKRVRADIESIDFLRHTVCLRQEEELPTSKTQRSKRA